MCHIRVCKGGSIQMLSKRTKSPSQSGWELPLPEPSGRSQCVPTGSYAYLHQSSIFILTYELNLLMRHHSNWLEQILFQRLLLFIKSLLHSCSLPLVSTINQLLMLILMLLLVFCNRILVIENRFETGFWFYWPS